jgi:hypothetical protein
VAGIEQLPSHADPSSWRRPSWLDRPPSGLAFGSSFCQHRLPRQSEVRAAFELAERASLRFSLVTPYVNQVGLDAAAALIDWLAGARPGTEVVVSDWGLLQRTTELPLVPVLSRLLHRQVRDPRLVALNEKPGGLTQVGPTWRAAASDSDHFGVLMRRVGARRVEMDAPLAGADGADASPSVLRTMHLPWRLVATGRLCPVQGLGRPSADRFTPPANCSAACRGVTLSLSAPWSSLPASGSVDLVQRGNTHFLRLNERQCRQAIEQTNHWRGRRLRWSSLPPV